MPNSRSRCNAVRALTVPCFRHAERGATLRSVVFRAADLKSRTIFSLPVYPTKLKQVYSSDHLIAPILLFIIFSLFDVLFISNISSFEWSKFRTIIIIDYLDLFIKSNIMVSISLKVSS